MEIKDQKEIQLTQTENFNKLSALLSVDSFFYGLFDDQGVLANSAHIDILKHPNIPEFLRNANSGCIGILNDLFTIIPHSDNDQLSEFDPLSHVDEPESELFFDELPNTNARLYYKLHAEQIRFLNENFDQLQHVHLISALVQNVALKRTGSFIHVTKIDEKLMIVVFDDGKVLMANSFQPSDDISLLYYLQLICHQYGIQKELLTIELSGIYSDPDKSTSFLDLYFDHVSYAHLDHNSTPSNFYSSLLKSILQCAS